MASLNIIKRLTLCNAVADKDTVNLSLGITRGVGAMENVGLELPTTAD